MFSRGYLRMNEFDVNLIPWFSCVSVLLYFYFILTNNLRKCTMFYIDTVKTRQRQRRTRNTNIIFLIFVFFFFIFHSLPIFLHLVIDTMWYKKKYRRINWRTSMLHFYYLLIFLYFSIHIYINFYLMLLMILIVSVLS